MHEVIPGILEKTFEEIEEKLGIIKPFSRTVHIDILDGRFSPETNFREPEAFKKYKNDFFMEVHLMVDDPTIYVKKFAAAGFNRFLGQIEMMRDMDEFIAEGQIFGEVGLAIDSTTQFESLHLPFENIDSILLMGVKAGKSGQTFLPGTLEKIKKIRGLTNLPLEIDGGINDETIVKASQAGANRFVATSYIFTSKDPMQAFEHLSSLA